MLDLSLVIAHHLAVFTLVGLFVAEWVLLAPGLTGDRPRQLARVDRLYGIFAALVIVAGVARVIFGTMGPDYYPHNWVFWAQDGCLPAGGAAFATPDHCHFRLAQGGRGLIRLPAPAAAITRVRRFFLAEALVLVFIPVFAAAMARGYGV